jgi:hypothetical protein
MFQTDPEGSQQRFESMESEPEVKEFENSNGESIRYYMYDLKD